MPEDIDFYSGHQIFVVAVAEDEYKTQRDTKYYFQFGPVNIVSTTATMWYLRKGLSLKSITICQYNIDILNFLWLKIIETNKVKKKYLYFYNYYLLSV